MKKCLGRGAQASVYQAHLTNEVHDSDLNPTESYAIKVFEGPVQLLSDITSEVQVHQQFGNHQNIMPLKAFYENSSEVKVPRNIPRDDRDQFYKWRQGYESVVGKPVMVFEECRYGDLFNFVRAQGEIRDPKFLKYLFLQVCQGLNALHTDGNMAHMDIKLENILIGNDGKLKLCDFGMVQPADADLTKRMGTEMYMAPEV